ncbi:MAG TPA: hypothetical protein VFZ19_08550 [Solirubrobacterales bacterium]
MLVTAAAALGLLLFASAATAAPVLTVDASNAVIGGKVQATAELSESPNPSGEISFEVFAADDPTCSEPPLDQSTVTVTGEGQYLSEEFEPPAPGTYSWSAHYSGDGENAPADSVCSADSEVAKATPSLAGDASDGVVGTAIHDEVTLSGGFSPTGEVTFSVYSPTDTTCTTPLDTDTVTIDGGTATSPDFLAQQAGEFRWTASYSGDANNEAASLACNAANQTSTVAKATPSLTGSASDGVVGTAIHDAVTLSGGFSPTGEVTFSVYAPTDTTCTTPLATTSSPITGGQATSPDYLPQEAGEFRWTASYLGDANNEAVELPCGTANQSSLVAKATPSLSGSATSAVIVGETITDGVTLSGGFSPNGTIVFRAYGPGDETCANASAYEAEVTVSGNGPYSPPGFAPGPGLYQWTAEYEGDADNEAVGLPCGAADQASAVGTIAVTLASGAGGGTVGTPVTATAALGWAAIPSGQITFRAFFPADTNCSGAPAFSSVVEVSGNGGYRSAAFVPAKVGTYRWTVAYSGDPNHAPATTGCGEAASRIVQAQPSISGVVPQRATVGTAFTDTVTLQGGFAPRGTITFRIYGPVASGCAKASFVNTVAVNGNGTFSSDPFVALRPGRYSFVASYSGDAANQSASESCDSPTQVVQVGKRAPKVKPRAILIAPKQISIRARLSGSVAPAGALSFRLYAPGDKRCARKPAFSGSISVKRNGVFSLGRYLATRPGTYRLSVGYSGDKRNQRYKPTCRGAQTVTVK